MGTFSKNQILLLNKFVKLFGILQIIAKCHIATFKKININGKKMQNIKKKPTDFSVGGGSSENLRVWIPLFFSKF